MVKLIFVILSVALIVNSIIAKANEKDIKKTNKFNIDPALLKNAKFEGDLLLKENLKNLFYPSYRARFQERKKRRVLNALTLKDLDDIVARLMTSSTKTMTPDVSDSSGQDFRKIGDVDWMSSANDEDDIDDEGVWYEKSVQPSYEFLAPTKRFSDFAAVRKFKPSGSSPSNMFSGYRSYYYQ